MASEAIRTRAEQLITRINSWMSAPVANRELDLQRAIMLLGDTRDLLSLVVSPSEPTWQPMSTVPDDVMEALLFWPAFKLDEGGNLTTGRAGKEKDLVGRSYRHVSGGAWEEVEPELEANGAHFGDDWEYGPPTHWMKLPDPPVLPPASEKEP